LDNTPADSAPLKLRPYGAIQICLLLLLLLRSVPPNERGQDFTFTLRKPNQPHAPENLKTLNKTATSLQTKNREVLCLAKTSYDNFLKAYSTVNNTA